MQYNVVSVMDGWMDGRMDGWMDAMFTKYIIYYKLEYAM